MDFIISVDDAAVTWRARLAPWTDSNLAHVQKVTSFGDDGGFELCQQYSAKMRRPPQATAHSSLRHCDDGWNCFCGLQHDIFIGAPIVVFVHTVVDHLKGSWCFCVDKVIMCCFSCCA